MTSPGSFREQLELVVNATTAGGEAGFARLTGSAREADRAATDAGESVARAAQRVADARQKEADAAGAVRVAEQRLTDLRERGITSGTQYVAAEEKLETARRRQHAASRDVEQATEAVAAAERKAASAAEDLGDKAQGAGVDLDELKKKAAAFAGGLAIGDWARDAISGFATMARDTGQLARSMNATTAEAGAFLGLVGSLGLELGDLLEIQAEFATKTKDGLTLAGTELQHNADGTVNWSNTLIDALDTLQEIPDATERNRLGFGMFGEEGYKQLSRLVNSGTDVKDALAKIGVPITDEDIAAVADYDATMLDLSLTSGELGRTLGRAVIPAITGLVEAGQDLVDIVSGIPGPIALTGAAAVVLGIGMRSAGVEGTFLAGAMARAAAATAPFRATAALTGTTSAALGVGLGAAQSGASALLGALGGPLGVGLIVAGGAWYAASQGAEDLETHAREAAVELAAMEGPAGSAGDSVKRAAAKLRESAGAWETYAATMRGTTVTAATELNGFEQTLVSIGGALNAGAGPALTRWFADTDVTAVGFEGAIAQAREELAGLDEQSAIAQLSTRSLNDLIAEGTTTGDEFTTAVRNAAEAQEAESRTTDIAAAAIAAHNAVTRDAVQATYDFITARYDSENANFAFLNAMDEAKTATDDATTSVDEARVAQVELIEAALGAASASADAAIENARASGTILDAASEASIRADSMLADLRGKLDTPGLGETARAELQGIVDKLQTARDNGDIEAILSLTGAEETAGELDETTKDRDAVVKVESRGGPAVDEYLDRLASAARLAIVQVESRGGPDVRAYLQTLADMERLAIIRTESRGGPAVAGYLDSIAAEDRLAIIRVETRGGPEVRRYLDSLADTRTAIIAAQGRGAGLRGAPAAGTYATASSVMLGSVTLDLELTGSADRAQLSSAQRGAAYVRDVKAYERESGTGWRRQP